MDERVLIDDRPEDEIVAEILEKHGGDEETARQIVRMAQRRHPPDRIELPDLSVEIIVGGRGYGLDHREADFLVQWLETYALPIDDDAEPEPCAMALLAFEINEATLQTDTVPIEPTRFQLALLDEHVLRDVVVKGNARLSALTNAVRRFNGNPENRSLQ
jgi:hypothetical protein